MGKEKRLELWWQLHRTSLPVWDLQNFRPMDFCWHECTHWIGSWIWPRAGLAVVEKREFFCHCLESNHDFSIDKPIAWWSLYRLSCCGLHLSGEFNLPPVGSVYYPFLDLQLLNHVSFSRMFKEMWGSVIMNFVRAGLHPQSPVTLHDNLQRKALKPYGLSTSVRRLRLVRNETNTGTSTALTATSHWSTRTTSRTFPACDISLGSQVLPAPEAGDFMELLLVCQYNVWLTCSIRTVD